MKPWLEKALKVYTVFSYIVLAAIALAALGVGIIVCVASSAKIPTNSMQPTLKPGDMVVLDKTAMGARLYSLDDARDNKPLNIKRLPALRGLHRGDVAVFNFPYPQRWDSIGFSLKLFYCKRCVALPGDTVEIKNGFTHVRGIDGIQGHKEMQRELAHRLSHRFWREQMSQGPGWKAYPPGDSTINWTIADFGPFWLPAKESEIELNDRHASLYRRLIEWETRSKLTRDDSGHWLIGDSAVTHYTFTHGYYFMQGDNCLDSQDSRYWGPVPDDFIAGRVTRIWWSRNRRTGQVNRDRILQAVN